MLGDRDRLELTEMIHLIPYGYEDINHLIEDIPKYVDKLKELWRGLVQQWDKVLGKVTNNYTVIMHSEEILIGLIVLVLLILVVSVWLIKRSYSKPRVITKPVSAKEALKAAKLSAKAGNFVRAGEYYEQGKDYHKAIKMYLKGRAQTRAATVYAKKLNNPNKAVGLLLDNKLFDPLAQLYADMDQHAKAAEYFLKAGKQQMAAESFEKSGEYYQAAELYRKSSRLAEAARCYSKAQVWDAAAEMYTGMYREYKRAIRGKEGTRDLPKLQDLAKKAASHLKQAGNYKTAAEICLDAGLSVPAADMFVMAGELDRAAEIYVDQKEHKKAAEIFAKTGDKRKAAEIMAHYHHSHGEGEQAVKFMVMSGDYLGAADIFAGKGQYIKAAELFIKGGDSRTAAEMYVAAGRIDLAVGLYERQGDLEAAIRMCEETGNEDMLANLYERTRRYFDAARIHQEQGNVDKAMVMLGKVTHENPNFAQAQYRLGQIHMDRGEFKQALDKLQAMAGRLGLSPQTLDQYYLLAMAYEKADHPMYAMGVFHQIARINYNYKDVVMRINVLTQKLAQQGQAQAAKASGTIAHRYRVVKELGRGGMGVVYLAQDLHLDRQVAFKVLPEELKANAQMVEFFIREAKSLAKLNHPYIVSIFDAGQESGVNYIIMEYVDGKDFKDLMGEGKRLPVSAGIQVFSQLAQALDYAHELKIVHRDIKPANIMWTRNRTIKVMDFGLAKVVDHMREGRSVVAGTPYYMSPEQFQAKNVDHRSDIYSMGITVYELLTGKVPFVDGDIGYHHLHTTPQPPRQLNSQIPVEVERIILKCMAKDIKQRYQSARDVFEDLLRTTGPGGNAT